MMILVGVEHDDTADDVEWLVKKTLGLRIFDDDAGVMNRSVLDVGGEILVVSQFTLHASTRKGNRPSYIRAARPETAVPLYRDFIDRLNEALPKPCGEGEFGADSAGKTFLIAAMRHNQELFHASSYRSSR